MRPMAAADVRVLGSLEVVGENGPIALAAKQMRLLAVLVAAGRPCGIDELVEAVWDGSAPASARKLVQVYVSQLRKVLPAGIAIVTRPGAYVAEVAPDDVSVGMAVEAVWKPVAERVGSILDIAYFRPGAGD